MNINFNGSKNNFLHFGDALSTKQEKQYEKLMTELKSLQGHQDGLRVVKIYTPSIPSSKEKDTGIGKVTSDDAKRMYEIAKTYGGANCIKFMPMGQLTDKQPWDSAHYAGAFQRGAFTIGEDIIDLFELTGESWGNILPEKEAEKFSKKHTQTHPKEDNLVDFGTELGYTNQQDYPINKPLKIAFENFKTMENPSEKLIELREEFEEFKNQKEPVDYDDIYTRLALFPYIKDSHKNFFVGFDSNPAIREQKMPEYNRLKEEYKNEIEFFKFKQFVSSKMLHEAKNMINEQNMDLMADVAICFSYPEEQSFPDAFAKNSSEGKVPVVGRGIRTLNLYDIKNDKNSPASKLLEAKISHFMLNYDAIRLDMGFIYISPSYHWGDKKRIHIGADGEITDFIADTAKKIKGDDFDERKIVYECDTTADIFDLSKSGDKINNLRGMAVLSTEEERNDDYNIGWGSLPYFKYNLGLNDDSFILGTNNHDKEGVLRCSENKAKSSEQVGALQRVFKRREEDGYLEGWKIFKDDENKDEHRRKYIRSRFAEVDLAKHSFLQHTDLLGRYEKIDYHSQDNEKDYKLRLNRDWEASFHKALQNNAGYNAADVKSFRMEMDGTNEQYGELYQKALKYSAYLKHKGGILTREQADKSSRADLNIEDLSLSDINNLDVIC